MTDLLQLAVRRLEALPGAEQDRQAVLLLSRLDAHEALRRDVRSGIDEADAGQTVSFDAEDVVRRGEARLGLAASSGRGDGA